MRRVELFCDDCFCVFKKLKERGEKIDLVITDLPYGVTQNSWDKKLNLPQLWSDLSAIVKKNGVIIFTAIEPFTSQLVLSNVKDFKEHLIYKKPTATDFLNAKKRHMRFFEDVLIFSPAKLGRYIFNPQKIKRSTPVKLSTGQGSSNYGFFEKKQVFSDSKYPSSIIDISYNKNDIGLHPTQKPIALLNYLIRTYSNKGDTVLDFCAGSGSTGVACVECDRSFLGVEKDEKFFKIMKSRIYDDHSNCSPQKNSRNRSRDL